MAETSLETSLVHVCHAADPGQFVGCGAIVEGGYIATCRHVWRDAGGATGAVVIVFPRSLKEDRKPLTCSAPHNFPHFQMAPKVSAKTGSSASIVVNRSINGSNRTSGMVGINS